MRQNEILQQVDLFGGHSGQAALQKPEDALVGKPALCRFRDRKDQVRERIQVDRARQIEKVRYLADVKASLQMTRVQGKIGTHHRDIAVTEAVLPHQPADLRSDKVRLPARIVRTDDSDFPAVRIHRFAVLSVFRMTRRGFRSAEASEPGFQRRKRRSMREPGQRPAAEILRGFHFDARFGRKRGHLSPGPHSRIEHIQLRADVFHLQAAAEGQIHGNVRCGLQQLPDHLALVRRKTREAVQKDGRAAQKLRTGNITAEIMQDIFLRKHPLLEPFPERGPDDFQIRKLTGKQRPPRAGFAQIRKLFLIDTVLAELGDQRLQFFDKPRSADVPLQARQPVFHLADHASQKQDLSQIVEQHGRFFPGLLDNEPCQPLKTDHVDVHAPVPGMQVHHIRLGLQRVLFRNDHKSRKASR